MKEHKNLGAAFHEYGYRRNIPNGIVGREEKMINLRSHEYNWKTLLPMHILETVDILKLKY